MLLFVVFVGPPVVLKNVKKTTLVFFRLKETRKVKVAPAFPSVVFFLAARPRICPMSLSVDPTVV